MRNFDLPSGIKIQKFVDKKTFVKSSHSHPYYEFLYVRHASFNYLIEDEIVSPVNNSIILVDKNTIHKALYADTDIDTYIIVQFYGSLIEDELKADLENLFKNRILTLSDKDMVLIDFLMNKAYKESKERKNNRMAMLKYQLHELIEILYRISVNNKTGPSPSAPSTMEKAITYINENLFSQNGPEITLQSVADQFHMSPYSFSKMFKRESGIGFKEYIISAKILQAKKLLASTDYPITEIAFLSGFTDSNYFSSVFKKYESVTPSEYSKFIKKYN
ncbi:MAG: helix-turn-helix transcriptional regulator [Clostridia bacterium]|nr:helix-turn-helix transcriptional regulator [Clostridia bacterium]MBQ7038560.1 helix-turn-helix transcriptional regulator [Clostridia bacterium]